MAKVLVIDDEPLFCDLLHGKLSGLGHEVESAHTLQESIQKAESGSYDVVYLDVKLPDGNGLDSIGRLKGAPSAPEVIIMTGGGDPDGAELAIRSGAWDYLEKVSLGSGMHLSLLRALQYRETNLRAGDLPAGLKCDDCVVGKTQIMRSCYTQVIQAARSDISVLMEGETGTGKELAAWTIHSHYPDV